ncbi:MAG: RluA family pseudouridine synthase [Planctomycetaceae bacterium]|nr:RluA family pseudouridine synthase [Planctomycetaceae bacterium]
MQILYEDNHLLAVVKPCGLATMGLAAGEETLLTCVKDYIKRKYDKPGEVYLGVVSRLDVPVSGVVLFARTSKAAARLNEQFRTHSVTKIYVALAEGSLDPPEGEWVDWIQEDKRHRKVWLTRSGDGKEAKLQYRTLQKIGVNSMIEIRLETGRKHQIRVQLAGHGSPIFGDGKYGAKTDFPNGIALHAWKLSVTHPTTQQHIELTASLPAVWKKFAAVF